MRGRGFDEPGLAEEPVYAQPVVASLGLEPSFIAANGGETHRQEFPVTASGRFDDLALIGATYLGGSAADDLYEVSIAVGRNGVLLVSGFTASSDFPVTPGTYGPRFLGGQTDRFITAFENELSRISASTYVGSVGAGAGFIGGDGDDYGHALVIDSEGNVFIAGYTESADYPVTVAGFDTTYNGGRDVFVSKFDRELRTLLASTFIGGSGDEGYRWPRIDMTLNAEGDVIIAGITHSVDFPVTTGAFDREFNGGGESGDVFVSVFDSDLRSLKASTFLGGSDDEWRVSVCSLEEGSLLVCGETASADFPSTAGAYSRALNVVKDAFIARFNAELTTLEAATLFGGSKLDEALDIECTPSEEVVVTGYTESDDLPVTANSYCRRWRGGKREGYAAKFDRDLGTLISSTFFGGSKIDFARALALDSAGNVYITGNTTSHDFPVTAGAFSTTFRGGESRGDMFVLVLDSDLAELRYSTLVGGQSEDTGFSITLDDRGKIFVAGNTSSIDFPMIEGSWDSEYNGGDCDNVLISFSAPH